MSPPPQQLVYDHEEKGQNQLQHYTFDETALENSVFLIYKTFSEQERRAALSMMLTNKIRPISNENFILLPSMQRRYCWGSCTAQHTSCLHMRCNVSKYIDSLPRNRLPVVFRYRPEGLVMMQDDLLLQERARQGCCARRRTDKSLTFFCDFLAGRSAVP